MFNRLLDAIFPGCRHVDTRDVAGMTVCENCDAFNVYGRWDRKEDYR